jgi:hypothetical protein
LTDTPGIPLAVQRGELRASMLLQRQVIAGRLGCGPGIDRGYPRSVTMHLLMLLVRARFFRS